MSESQKSEYTKTQVLAALTVSIGSMVIGYSNAYTSPAIQSLKEEAPFKVSEEAATWIGGIIGLGGFFGSIIGGTMISYFGRRKSIILTGVPFIVVWLSIAFSKSIYTILVARAFAGICIGIASLAFPVYLGETIHPNIRGTLGLFPTVFGNGGLVFCFILGAFLNWSNLAIAGAIIPVPFVLLMFIIPETPYWYISKGREEKAVASLEWLRGPNADIASEIQEINRSFSATQRRTSTNAFKRLTFRENMRPLLISITLMFFQQFSGINAVIFYAIQIFKNSGSSIDDNVSAIIIGIVNLMATLLSTVLVDRVGRKILIYASNAIMIITLACFGSYLYYQKSSHDTDSVGWLPLACLMVYVVGFSLGMGPIPWLMMGEILPSKVRNVAASIVTASNWLFSFIVTKIFFTLTDTIGAHGTFWFFGAVCICAVFFSIKFVPETRGKTLEEIEIKMMNRKT